MTHAQTSPSAHTVFQQTAKSQRTWFHQPRPGRRRPRPTAVRRRRPLGSPAQRVCGRHEARVVALQIVRAPGQPGAPGQREPARRTAPASRVASPAREPHHTQHPPTTRRPHADRALHTQIADDAPGVLSELREQTTNRGPKGHDLQSVDLCFATPTNPWRRRRPRPHAVRARNARFEAGGSEAGANRSFATLRSAGTRAGAARGPCVRGAETLFIHDSA